MELKCRIKLTRPEQAGAASPAVLREWAAAFPHLRPCPKRDWWWINRTACEKCPHAERVEED